MPPVPPHERLRTQRTAMLSQGISQQPPSIRLVAQVADAENANFSIVDGLTRRPGSFIQQHVAEGLRPAANNRLHGIVRDQTERYIVVHNRTSAEATIRVLELATNRWGTVDVTAAAHTYLNSASPDEFRFRTLLDYTLILNTEIALAGIEYSGTIAGSTGAITGTSATSPTIITSVAHGLTTGDTVWLHETNSFPSVDGQHVVIVTGVDTFTIPIVVNTAGTTGWWVKEAITAPGTSPTTIRSVAHGRTTGDTVVIANSDSTPHIDGPHVVTVTDADHFTIPVKVTEVGYSGTWSVGRLNPVTMPVKMVRRNTGGSGTVNAVSATNPAVISTGSPHGLVSGQSVTFAGTVTTPSLNSGSYVVTVLTPTTFSIPVNVTAGSGAAGTWASLAYFTIDVITWNDRPNGDTKTNPTPPLWANGTKLSDLRYWRGRLWLFGGQRITSSQAEDLFNFWVEDVNFVSDSDPVDVTLSSDEVTDIDFAVPARNVMLLLTKAGIQFVFTAAANQGVTPTSVQAFPVTRHRTISCEPAAVDPAVYYAANDGDNIQLLEYIYDEVEAPRSAEEVSGHVPTLMPLTVDVPDDIGDYSAEPSQLRRIAVSVEQGMVFLLRKDKVTDGEVFSRFIYVYRTRYVGQQKVQSAWTRWQIAGVRGIHDIVVIGNYLYFLAHCGPNTEGEMTFYIGRLNLPAESAADRIPVPTT